MSESLDWAGQRSSLQVGDMVLVERPDESIYRFVYADGSKALMAEDLQPTESSSDIGLVTDVRTTGDVRVLIGDSQVWTVVSRCTKVQGTST
jgi:hypothetical protein